MDRNKFIKVKEVSTVILVLFSTCVLAQSKVDTVMLLNGEYISCTIRSITEQEIQFMYPNETIQNTLSINRIQYIQFGSGRVQHFSKKVIVGGIEDWEKVTITKHKEDVIGLKLFGEVKGKANGTALANMNGVRKRSERRIKEKAAQLGAHIILIRDYFYSESQPGRSLGKINIVGEAYGYE